MQFHAVERVAGEVEIGTRAHARQVGGDVAAVVFEQQAVPLAQLVIVQVQAGVVREVGCPQQLAARRIGPPVQRADDVAACAALGALVQRTATLEHDRLAVAADVGNQLNARGGAHQGTTFTFLGQGVVVTRSGHGELVPDIARTSLEDIAKLKLVQGFVEVA